MSHLTIKVIWLALLVAYPFSSLAKTTFKIFKQEEDYYTQALINGQEARPFMIETGAAAIVTNSADFNELFLNRIDMVEVDSVPSVLRFDRREHKVLKMVRGVTTIGEMVYDGPIIVIDDFDDLLVPIHRLRNPDNPNQTLISFDIKKGVMEYVTPEENNLKTKNVFKLYRLLPWPTFEADFEMRDAFGNNGGTRASFIFDMGCSTQVYFMGKSPVFIKFIKENGIKLQRAAYKKGEENPERKLYGINSPYFKIGNKTHRGIHIGIASNVHIYDCIGCIGPSFFGDGKFILDLNDMTLRY